MQIADLSEIRYKNPLAAYQHNKIAFKFLLKTKTEKMAKPLKTSANTHIRGKKERNNTWNS